jgi:hypothetical protein
VGLGWTIPILRIGSITFVESSNIGETYRMRKIFDPWIPSSKNRCLEYAAALKRLTIN